jgi:ubiquinone/menaquinone biosynthesis C-methylase UbiE
MADPDLDAFLKHLAGAVMGRPSRVDVVHAHQVLQHVDDPVQALREMRCVCKPGGLVAVRDSDYLGFTWFPEVSAFDEWMRLYQQAALARCVPGVGVKRCW